MADDITDWLTADCGAPGIKRGLTWSGVYEFSTETQLPASPHLLIPQAGCQTTSFEPAVVPQGCGNPSQDRARIIPFLIVGR